MGVVRLAAVLLAIILVSIPPGHTREFGDQDTPVLITADELSRDDELGAVIARGNVEITQGDRILMADSVSYNEKSDTVSASGNVRLMEPTGEVIFAEFVELRDQFKNGIVKQIRVLLNDDSRFAAHEARRADGNLLVMKRGVYSPCEACKKNPDRPLIWQIKARQIEHDELRQEVRYQNAFLELFGLPVAYIPYFTHPDPTVKRKSGFLAPDFGAGGNLNGFVRTPYFLTFGDDKDATISPIYTVDEGLVFSGEYRQRFNKGEVKLSGSVTEADRTDTVNGVSVTEQDKLRGFGEFKGRYDIDPTWRIGADAQRSTDRTYLKRFDFFEIGQDVLSSNAYLEGFRPRTYAAANLYAFQDLRPPSSRPEQPIIAPLLQFNHVGEADRFSGRLSLDADFRLLTRTDGPTTQRVSFRPGYEISHTADAGFVTTFSASVLANFYNVQQTAGPTFRPDIQDNVSGRLLPRATLQWRFPFVNTSGSFRKLIEPIAMVTATPNGQNPKKIPNEDSTVFEADDSNLLSPDRLPGIDRVESGQRVVYGLRFGIYGSGNSQMTAFIGQSYRPHTDNSLNEDNFIEEGLSDIVGRVDLTPMRYVDILYRFAFSSDDLGRPKRNEVSFALGPPALKFEGFYSFVDASGDFQEREEIKLRVSTKITDHWSLVATTHRNLAEGRSLKHSGILRYEDECFGLELVGTRSFFDEEDIDPSDSLLIRIKFKHLGEVGTTTG